MRRTPQLLTVLATFSLLTTAAYAQELRIGYSDPISSLDPQLNNHAGDHNAAQMLFASLSPKDVNGPVPYLAESWELVDPNTWEFKLRESANFSDGSPVTAADIAYSYSRARDVPGSVASFRGFLRTVDTVDVVDDKTLRIKTNVPNPILPVSLSTVYIVKKETTKGAASEDFNSGEALVGPGPYLLEEFVPGSRIKMMRNDDYWGSKPEWKSVEFQHIANPAARTAALLAGDVDMIDKVSLADLNRLQATDGVTVHSYPGLRVLMLQPSFTAGPNEFLTDKSGAPLDVNPLLKQKVRQAMSIAINRDAIVDRIMSGGATVASQWMPEGSFGYDPETGPIPYDPEGAKALLAEAGYPEGFGLTVHVPGDRYPMATETAQAIAQFWTRIGIDTRVEAVPYSVYSGRANKNEYAVSMIGWGNGTGEGSYAMTTILATHDKDKGLGASNWNRYSSERHDAILTQVTSEFDEEKREALMHDAVKVVMEEVGVIPLFHYKMNWATRDGLKVVPWTSDRTVPMQVSTVSE